jgi:hypothetical protein
LVFQAVVVVEEQVEEQANLADVEDVMEKAEAIPGKNCFDDASFDRALYVKT